MAERRTGRTINALRSAPRAAIYVWKNDRLSEPRHTARWLQRTDLQIVGPAGIEDVLREKDAPVVVDHAAILPPHLEDLIDHHNKRRNAATKEHC